MTIIRPLRAVAAAVIGIGTLAGCGAATDDYAREGTVLLVATATANEPAPTLPSSATTLLERASASEQGTARILVPQDGQTVAHGESLPVTVTRNGEVEHDPREIADGLARITGRINTELATLASGQTRLDALTGLSGAARLSDHATIVLLSSGLQTAGLADFAGLGRGFDPSTVVADLAAAGFVPDLGGKDVYFAGLGEVAGRQDALPDPMRSAVTALWLAICEAGRARTCAVLPADPAQAPSADRTTGVKTVPVPVFALTSLPAGAGTTDWTLDSDTLFEADSAVLQPKARTGLGEVARTVADRGGRVDLTGHTWRVGPADGARDLSRARAAAVADALVAAGLPVDGIGSVRGVGYDEPQSPRPGQDEAAANRVVTVRVTTV